MMFAIGVVLFALAILLSVALHECGHMWVARATGMKVRRYFVGFGPTLWSTRRPNKLGETEYGLKAVPLGGFLPTADDLSAALGTGPNGFMGPTVEGGEDTLLRSVGEAQVTPADCAGAPYRLQQVVYRDSPVLSVASASWAGGGFDAAPVSAFVGVVQMSSAAAAQDFFATTTERWRRCERG